MSIYCSGARAELSCGPYDRSQLRRDLYHSVENSQARHVAGEQRFVGLLSFGGSRYLMIPLPEGTLQEQLESGVVLVFQNFHRVTPPDSDHLSRCRTRGRGRELPSESVRSSQ